MRKCEATKVRSYESAKGRERGPTPLRKRMRFKVKYRQSCSHLLCNPDLIINFFSAAGQFFFPFFLIFFSLFSGLCVISLFLQASHLPTVKIITLQERLDQLRDGMSFTNEKPTTGEQLNQTWGPEPEAVQQSAGEGGYFVCLPTLSLYRNSLLINQFLEIENFPIWYKIRVRNECGRIVLGNRLWCRYSHGQSHLWQIYHSRHRFQHWRFFSN